MKILPYMKWFPSDVETDEAWILMNMAERGLYITLLNYSWINSGIPSETWKIARLTGLSEEELSKLWPRVSVKFCPSADDDERLINSRQEEERSGAALKSLKASCAAAHSVERKRPGYVYLIQRSSDGAVKIGSSENVAHRLSQLRYKYRSSDALSLVAQIPANSMGDLELALQKKHSSSRSSGEWFSLSLKEIEQITLEGDICATPHATPWGGNDNHPALRAYESDSNCISNSSSERESEGKPEDTEKELDEFSVWADAVYLRHPKQKNEYLSKLALKTRFAGGPESRALFDKNHLLWLEYWKDEDPKFVPPLCTDTNSGFVPDSTWKKPPPKRIQRGKQVDETKRILEEKYGVKF